MDDDWSHEQQDVLEALNQGDSGPLVEYMLNGGKIPEMLREAVEHKLKSGSFLWKPTIVKVGRPSEDIWSSIGFLREKKVMQRLGTKSATDIEYELAEKYGLSHDSLVKKLKEATAELKCYASREGGDWATKLLNLNKEK